MLGGTNLQFDATEFSRGFVGNGSTAYTVNQGGAYRISYSVGLTTSMLVGTRVVVNGVPEFDLTLQPSTAAARFVDEAIVNLPAGSTVSFQFFGLLGAVTLTDAGLVIEQVG